VYAQPAFAYRPSYCIGYDVLTTYLFARPNYCHYYFGDYFAPRYAGSGYRPWFQSRWGRGNYDPLFAHYRHVNRRHDRNWDRRLVDRYAYLRDNEGARPPRTLAAQQAGPARIGRDGRPGSAQRGGEIQIAQSLDRFRQSSRDRYGVQLGQASSEQLERATQRRKSWQDLQASRKRAETADNGATPGSSTTRDPRRARWNAENPIARDVPNVRGPQEPGVPRPEVGQGLARPGRGGRLGNAQDDEAPSNSAATRPDLGNRTRDRGNLSRDRGNIGRDRENALGNRPGATEDGSRQTLRPIPRPGVDTQPGVEANRPTLDRPGRGRPPFEGSPQRRRPQATTPAGGNAPAQPNGPTVQRASPDRSGGGNRSAFERPGRTLPPPRDNVLRVPRSSSPAVPQAASPQPREPRSFGPSRGAGQRPAGPSQPSASQINRPNVGRQTMQRPITPPAPSTPALSRPTPSPRMQAPGNTPGGGARPNPGQFRRPTAGGAAALGSPQGRAPRPQVNRAPSNPAGGQPATEARGRGRDD
jgi:hypothetical protein